MKADRDYIWQADYGNRSHLVPCFQRLLGAQPAQSMQTLTLLVNNNPYNLEFFVWVSYDKPELGDIPAMTDILQQAGLRYRPDLSSMELFRQMGSRRFNTASLLAADTVEDRMNALFFFAERYVLREQGYTMEPWGKTHRVFISHSSWNKPEVEELLPYLNGAHLNVWFDKYSIELGEFLTDSVQGGIESSDIVLFWVTGEFLASNWCKMEMRSFIGKLIAGSVTPIIVLDREIAVDQLPLFLRDIKHIRRETESVEELVGPIVRAIKAKGFGA